MAKKKENAIAKQTEVLITDFKQSSLAGVADVFDVNDTIKGVKGRIPQIKISHQAQIFTNKDKTQKFDTFKGIILHHSPVNAYWEVDFDVAGGGTPPDCSSLNAEKPDTKECKSEYCYNCPLNQFGTGKEGKGKACKNMWRLHILVEGQQIPKRLTLPPSNTGVLQDFLISLRDMNIPHELAIIEFSLVATKNKNGIEYSLIQFNPVAVVNDKDKALNLKKTKEQFAAAFGEVIDVEEYSNSDTPVDEKKAKY